MLITKVNPFILLGSATQTLDLLEETYHNAISPGHWKLNFFTMCSRSFFVRSHKDLHGGIDFAMAAVQGGARYTHRKFRRYCELLTVTSRVKAPTRVPALLRGDQACLETRLFDRFPFTADRMQCLLHLRVLVSGNVSDDNDNEVVDNKIVCGFLLGSTATQRN